MNLKLIILIFILILLVFYFKESFKDFEKYYYKVDKFDNEAFKRSFEGKTIIICGNSRKFPESFKKVEDPDSKFIIRFNSILDYIDNNDKTDVLLIADAVLEEKENDEFKEWKKKCKNCKIFFVQNLLKNNKILDNIETKINYTSGFITLTYLLNYTTDIILVGFDLPDDYDTPVNWYRNNNMYKGHDIKSEKELLLDLVNKYNIKKI